MSAEEKTLALVGGTGLNQFTSDVESLHIDTPYGAPSAEIQIFHEAALRLMFLPRHGSPHRFPPHNVNYRANMWALREAGADHVLAVSAVGGISPSYRPGTLVAPDQLIDYSWGRKHTYCDSEHVDLVHVDFTRPYDGPLRRALLKAARSARVDVTDGGCIPEASLARELGLDYAGLAVISNWAAGVTDGLISEDDIAETLREPMSRVRKLVRQLAKQL
jgi:5'-methylthioinosine phosphorylase